MLLPALPIVHETPGLLFVDKPPGLSFHRAASTDDPGVLPLLRAMQQSGALAYDGRLLSVHRLDRVTSGLLMVAKSAEAARSVGELLRRRAVDKYYVALSERKPSKRQGRVSGDMARSRRGQWKLLRTAADPAVTTFVSARVDLEARALRAFLLKPHTGRTHQLRVALKCLGAPVLGDPMYAASEDAAREERAYLHATALRLPAGFPELTDSGEALAVCCRPRAGDAFRAAAFQSQWDAWFPLHEDGRAGEPAGGQIESAARDAPSRVLHGDIVPWFAGTPVASRVS
jgi:tRNA pseudouridine32 synthase/23S rRNA pseudouridine746 synthase